MTLSLAGCTPAGPRALLKGKKYLDHGAYAEAVDQLRTATSLLATNAAAWNYYGVALQGAGHPDEAAAAYQSALKYDRDLVEAHYNFGVLSLEQNKADMARTEFTAYTLHRPNDVAGWLKLGSAQLRLGDTVSAERSFSTVYHIDANNPEALNGLGLARVQSGKPQDAVKFFAAAVKIRPDYAAAILNQATVSQQYLHDNKAALDSYHEYLALKTRPANWAEVSAVANGLEASEMRVAVVTPPPVAEKPVAVPMPPAPGPAPVTDSRPPTKNSPVISPRPVVTARPVTPVTKPAIKPMPVQVVEVQPEVPIVTTPRPETAQAAVQPPAETNAGMEMPVPEEPPKKGFWSKIFRGQPPGDYDSTKYRGEGLTPLPANNDASTETKPVVVPAAKPLETYTPAPVFARYNYYSPAKPVAGDRRAASGSFTKARLFEQDENWTDALSWYQEAAVLDPSWFEAQYNTGVLAHRLRNYTVALPRYEMALAVQPNSTDARYNFALALKAANYPVDAAEQLKIILAESPKEVRAHLALANICAQSLRDTPQAREHYQAVLELDPGNPQTSDIRFWLSSNPK
ncbi:MAG TPA: tetratricopeptide repeat protein [Verrucomicrobiae bacterium]|nr:tetratricopeptide repeat protein [Verrucomicrobiae bacterium]